MADAAPKKKRLKRKRLRKAAPIVKADEPTTLVQAGKKLKKKLGVKENPAEKKYTKAIAEAKRQAEVDFVTDPESRDYNFHYYRDDRDYKKLVELSTFKDWQHYGEWINKRKHWWLEIQDRTLIQIQDRYVKIRVQEVERLQVAEDNLFEYLTPLRDAEGKIKRDKKTQLPLYQLPLGSVSNVATTLLAVMERKMALRGDLVARAAEQEGNVHLHQHLHVGAEKAPDDITDISSDEAQKLSRVLITMRDPKLAAAYQQFIDTDGEELTDG